MEGTIGSKPCYHCKEGQLAKVENCTGRQAASKEVHKRERGARVQAKHSLQLHFLMVIQGLEVLLAQNHSCEATEENREGIEQLNSQGSSRVT